MPFALKLNNINAFIFNLLSLVHKCLLYIYIYELHYPTSYIQVETHHSFESLKNIKVLRSLGHLSTSKVSS
jgi:hypothetical protein